jgi:prevent-host-death family protein
MREATIAELRKHTREYFDDVETGEVIRILRRGRPVADIVPVRQRDPSWREPVDRLIIPGLSLAQEILRDRAESE